MKTLCILILLSGCGPYHQIGFGGHIYKALRPYATCEEVTVDGVQYIKCLK